MKIFGAALAVLLIGGAYSIWGLSWPGVLAAGLVGVVLSQVMHATGWREVLAIAGTICLAAAGIGAFLLLLQLTLKLRFLSGGLDWRRGRIFLAWLGAHEFENLACHSRATTSKVLASCFWATFIARRAALGSISAATCFRTSIHFSRACPNPTAG